MSYSRSVLLKQVIVFPAAWICWNVFLSDLRFWRILVLMRRKSPLKLAKFDTLAAANKFITINCLKTANSNIRNKKKKEHAEIHGILYFCFVLIMV